MLVALIERLKKNEATVGPQESRFVFNGKAELQVWVLEKSPATMAALKELGFEIMLDDKNSMLLIGRLPIDKLETLLDSKSVKYVAPLMKR